MDVSKCPNCGSANIYVSDSRRHKEGFRRSRKCLECGHIAKTLEIPREEYIQLQEKAKKRERLINDLRAFCDKYEAEESEE